MNDEEFARSTFAAFRSNAVGEPTTMPDADGLAAQGRRAQRRRHGMYAAGTTALAGVVTAGVVTGPTILGFGGSTSVGAAAGSNSGTPSSAVASAVPSPTATVTASAFATSTAKPAGTRCTAPTINWLAVLAPTLPAGVTATQDHAVTCLESPDGSKSIEADFVLSTNVDVQITVTTGVTAAAAGGPGTAAVGVPGPYATLTASIGPGSSVVVPNEGPGSATPTPTPTATVSASTKVFDNAAGAAQAQGSCSPSGLSTLCLSHLSKGPFLVTEANVQGGGSQPLNVDVVVSNDEGGTASPTAGPVPPDSFAMNVAQAVAAAF